MGKDVIWLIDYALDHYADRPYRMATAIRTVIDLSETGSEYDRKTLRSMKLKLDPSDQRHGTYTGYHSCKCRCDACRKAGSDVNREYRESE